MAAAGLLHPDFEFKYHRSAIHSLVRQQYHIKKHYSGLHGFETHPDVVDLPPLVWHMGVNCAHLKTDASPCHAYLYFGGPNPNQYYEMGPDMEIYVPIYLQYLQAAGREQRKNSKAEFNPKPPFTPVSSFNLCSNHVTGVRAGKQRAAERLAHAATLKGYTKGPASYSNDVTAVTSPGQFGEAIVAGHVTKKQARSIKHQQRVENYGDTSGDDWDVVREYAVASEASEKKVQDALPFKLPEGVLPELKNSLPGKIHDISATGMRRGFYIQSTEMMIAAYVAAVLGDGGCHIDYTRNVMPIVFGMHMNALVFACPFPKFAKVHADNKPNPAISFIGLTSRQTQFDIAQALRFWKRAFNDTFGISSLPHKYFQSDGALEILAAVMEVGNNTKPMHYNMMVEFLLWCGLSVKEALAVVGTPLFWDIYHTTSSVYRWVNRQAWPEDQAKHMPRWIVCVFQAMRDCTDLRYLYCVVAVFITLLKTPKLPWKGAVHNIPISDVVPIRIRGRFNPSSCPEWKEIKLNVGDLVGETLGNLRSTINSSTLETLTTEVVDVDPLVVKAGTDCSDALQTPKPDDSDEISNHEEVEEIVDVVGTWLLEGDALPNAEDRVNKRMQATIAGSGHEQTVKCGKYTVCFLVNNGYFSSEYKVWMIEDSAATSKSVDGELHPFVLIGRKLRDQKNVPGGLEAWHFITRPRPYGVGVIHNIDPTAEEVSNCFFQGDACDVANYFNTTWLPYLVQFSSVLRSPQAGIPTGCRAAQAIEAANYRIKQDANEGRTVLNLWTVLCEWLGLVQSVARNTAAPFTTAFNNCVTGRNKYANGVLLLGWLDKEARACISKALKAHAALKAVAAGAPPVLVAGVDLDAGELAEGYHNRTGLDPRDRDGFTIPLETALAKLRDLLPGEAGTWKGQITGGAFKSFWSSLFTTKKMYKSMIKLEVVKAWTGSNVRTKDLVLPVPRPDNECALQYFALKAFMEMIDLEPEMLQLPAEHIARVIDRCRARMGALIHKYKLEGEGNAKIDMTLSLNLPPEVPLPLNLLPTAAVVDGEEDLEPGLCTQPGDTNFGIDERTGVTPTLDELTLAATGGTGGNAVEAHTAGSQGASPNKRVTGDSIAGTGDGQPAPKKRGRPRKNVN